MRCLLTHAFFLDEDPKEQEILRPYPPLGILYISAYLRGRGITVDLYDSTFGTRAELYDQLHCSEPGLLGLYVNLITRGTAIEIIEVAKAAGWTVVLGGPEPANYPQEYLAAGADYVVPGEGERAMERLLTRPLPAKGLLPTEPQIENLDDLPWPDRERIDVDRYLQAWRAKHGEGSVSLITARGCPYHCEWCSHSTYGKTHRRRSVNNVADEVEWIGERYSPDMLWYADDVFTIHRGWTLEYAKEMKRRGMKLRFECITRADRMDEAVADALAELGCFRVWIGSESGSQRILDAMRRGVKVEQVQRAVGLAKSRGIATGMFLMWGYEGEDLSDIEATVEHVNQARPDTVLTTLSYPIKGTPYFDKVSSKLVNIGNWRTSTDRDLGIAGRRDRAYYKHADELLRGTLAGDSARVVAARTKLRDK